MQLVPILSKPRLLNVPHYRLKLRIAEAKTFWAVNCSDDQSVIRTITKKVTTATTNDSDDDEDDDDDNDDDDDDDDKGFCRFRHYPQTNCYANVVATISVQGIKKSSCHNIIITLCNHF